MRNNFEHELFQAVNYFYFFNYPPTSEEIYTFLEKPLPFGRFTSILEKMVKRGVIKSWMVEGRRWKIDSRKLKIDDRKKNTQISTLDNLSSTFQTPRYTVGEYSKKISNIKYQISKRENNNRAMEQSINYLNRFKISKKKLNNWRFKTYLKFLSFCPQIKLVGLSGSISMMNADEDDDIDLFIITAKNRLFTGRFIALVLAQLFGLRRKRNLVDSVTHEQLFPLRGSAKKPQSASRGNPSHFVTSTKFTKNKTCLNLFFDESDLSVPRFKQSEYVAHEVLQMKPIINKSYSYERFLYANRWVKNLFPNTVGFISKIKNQRSKMSSKLKSLRFKLVFDICTLTFGLFEKMLKKLQLLLINRHRTTEIITNHQLWFHPEDFGKKIKT